jgi:hypothetical protein
MVAKWINIVSLGNMNEYKSYECSSNLISQQNYVISISCSNNGADGQGYNLDSII